MFIRDFNALAGRWPIQLPRYNDLAALDAAYAACGVDEVWISAVEAVLGPDPVLAERALFGEVENFPRFRPVQTLNPKMPGRLRQALAEAGKPGSGGRPVAYKVFPNYHGYAVESPEMEAAAEVAAAAKCPLLVQIRLNDERNQPKVLQVGPTKAADLARFARRHAGVTIVALSASTAELSALREGGPNLFADIALVDCDDPLAEAGRRFQAERLCFGSMAGLAYPEAAVLKLRWTDVPAETAAAISSGGSCVPSRAADLSVT